MREEIFISNLLKAYEQLHEYILIAICSNGIALIIAIFQRDKNSAPESEISVLGIRLSVSNNLIIVILILVGIVYGAMTYYSIDSANRILGHLDPSLTNAVKTYPGFATSPYLGVKYLPCMSSFLLSILTLLVLRRQLKLALILVWLTFLMAAHIPLILELSKSD